MPPRPTAETPIYVRGSLSLTLYNITVNNLANAAAPTTLTTTPIKSAALRSL